MRGRGPIAFGGVAQNNRYTHYDAYGRADEGAGGRGSTQDVSGESLWPAVGYGGEEEGWLGDVTLGRSGETIGTLTMALMRGETVHEVGTLLKTSQAKASGLEVALAKAESATDKPNAQAKELALLRCQERNQHSTKRRSGPI